MPKLVNYPARFGSSAVPAFVVVRDHGPQALSRRAVAAALGTSVNSVRRLLSEEADLRGLALDAVDRRRRQGRWGRPHGLAGPELAVHLLRTLLPDEECRVSEEFVRLHIAVDARQLEVPDDDSGAALRTGHAMADRGCLPDGLDTAAIPVPAEPLADRLAEHDDLLTCVVADARAAIGVETGVEAEAERRRTRALVSGLVLDTCLGRTTPEQAVATLTHHVASLTPAA